MGITAEVMDCTFGYPAEGIPVTLHREVEACWQPQGSELTDGAGQVASLATAPARGRYRLALDLDKYFSALGVEPFQSRVEITFRLFSPNEDVHFLMMITSSSTTTCRMVTMKQLSG